jgi:putative phosphoribosyl transferase
MGRLRFRDRQDAGQQLAGELRDFAKDSPLVLALPRGGVPVAFEVARALGAELDVWVVRKLGVPWHQELGVGAVAEGGQVFVSREIIEQVGLTGLELAQITETKRREVAERVRKFRGDRPRPLLQGRTVILVDDGIATGGTARAAIEAIRSEAPKKLVLAVPVAAPDSLSALGTLVDRVVCLLTPTDLHAIGLWYDDFTQVPDEEVIRLLERSRHDQQHLPPKPRSSPWDTSKLSRP